MNMMNWPLHLVISVISQLKEFADYQAEAEEEGVMRRV